MKKFKSYHDVEKILSDKAGGPVVAKGKLKVKESPAKEPKLDMSRADKYTSRI